MTRLWLLELCSSDRGGLPSTSIPRRAASGFLTNRNTCIYKCSSFSVGMPIAVSPNVSWTPYKVTHEPVDRTYRLGGWTRERSAMRCCSTFSIGPTQGKNMLLGCEGPVGSSLVVCEFAVGASQHFLRGSSLPPHSRVLDMLGGLGSANNMLKLPLCIVHMMCNLLAAWKRSRHSPELISHAAPWGRVCRIMCASVHVSTRCVSAIRCRTSQDIRTRER